MKIDNNTALVEDSFGNGIIVRRGGNTLRLSIRLANNPKERKIGEIDMSTRTLTVTRNRAKHLLQKGNAYGLNHKLIAEATRFDTVRIVDDFGRWDIPREYILENGKFLLFAKQGFELQIFISLEQIQQFKHETDGNGLPI
jgi:hypothetical protein